MAAGDQYRVRAAELAAEAKSAPNVSIRRQLEHLSMSYLRLAAQADHSSGPKEGVYYETPDPKPA